MYRKLYRSRKDNMIAGVAGGMAEYFDVDPALIRLLFVVTTFMGGIGPIAYIVMWIIVPYEPAITPASAQPAQAAAGYNTFTVDADGTTTSGPANTSSEGADPSAAANSSATGSGEQTNYHAAGQPQPGAPVYTKQKDNRALGVVLVAIGLVFLADNFIPMFSFWDYWPLLLIGIGIWILSKPSRKNDGR